MPKTWHSLFKIDPTPTLLSSGNRAIEYFAKRDLLEESVEPISIVWQLPEVQKILRNQQPDGSWRHSGKETVHYPKHHYSLEETWKHFWLLVERYELNRENEDAKRAAEFLFSCQTSQGDIRGLLANQYATYYTGAMLAVLIKAGYADDLRVLKGLDWLLMMRQDDGGWTIPILTHKYDKKTFYKLTSSFIEPVEPDRSKPFSHNWTDMVLRAFAAHPQCHHRKEAMQAADLLKSSFFTPDYYPSLQDAHYWVRFMFWWPNLVTALASLSLMGYSRNDSDIRKGLNWLVANQLPNGLWKLTYGENAAVKSTRQSQERSLWLALAIARTFKRFYEN